METLVFVYGSLTEPSLRLVVLGRDIETKIDVLKGYEKTLHTYFQVYPTIKENPNESVFGETFSVTDKELERLDRYETKEYDKIQVKLDSGRDALTYIEAKH